MSRSDLEEWWANVQKDLEVKRFDTFPALPEGEGWRVYWPDDEDIESFLNLAKSAQVSLIYSAANSFATSDIGSLLEGGSEYDDESEDDDEYDDENEDEAEILLPEVIEFKKRAETFLGRLSYASVAWFHNGIEHIFIREANWHEELRERALKVQDIIEEKAQQDSERNNSEIQARVALVHEKAEQLARNPDFADARAGFGGRTLIAKRIFPLLDPSLLTRVVSEAWALYQTDILPEKESALAQEARTLLGSGLKETQVAIRLGIRREKLTRLLAKYADSG